jgi:hypothetical protein
MLTKKEGEKNGVEEREKRERGLLRFCDGPV